MGRTHDFTNGFVLETPNKIAARFRQTELDYRRELLLLNEQDQLVVDIPLEQGFILGIVPLLKLVADVAILVYHIVGVVHQIEHVRRDCDGVFATYARLLNWIGMLVDHPGLVQIEDFNLIAQSFVTNRQVVVSIFALADNTVDFNIVAQLSEIELLIQD